MTHTDSPHQATSNANLRSIILMVAAMGCFTLVDLMIKIASRTLPIGQVMIMFGGGLAVLFAGLIMIKGETIRFTPLRQPAMLLRNAGDILAGITMSIALAYVPISIIGAVIQAVPLMLTAAAALFLGERVGIRRISAILVGFSGVLFIIQPGRSDFDLMVILAVMAAVGLTIRDIGTKLVSRDVSTLLVSFYASILYTLSGSVLLLISGGATLPDGGTLVQFAAMIALGALGYICVTNAVRVGDMSVVSPFRYSRMLFSVAVGIIILGEEVNSMMIFGCALTIGAGLYIWRRELVLKPEPVTNRDRPQS